MITVAVMSAACAFRNHTAQLNCDAHQTWVILQIFGVAALTTAALYTLVYWYLRRQDRRHPLEEA